MYTNKIFMGGWVMVLDATFNNISLISWSVGGGNQSTLRKHCPAPSH